MAQLQVMARLRRSFASRGIWGSLKHYAESGYRMLRPHKLATHPFDVKHGVQTTAHITGSKLGVGHKHDIYNTVYLPSHPSMVLSCIEQWRAHCEAGDPPLEAYTFLDLGCGMGRAVMVASDVAFRRVIGVEMNAGLCEQARKNLAVWEQKPHACGAVSIANAEASEFEWPTGPLAVYMFNPFEGPVVEAILEALKGAIERGAGPVDLLYVYPAFSEVIAGRGRARLLAKTKSYLSDEDRAVDPYNNPAEERYAVDLHLYRLVGRP